MKKKLLALLCALAVAVGLLTVPASAAGGIFFLSLNDTLPAQSLQTTPIQYNGWIYVPANIFSSRVTGINFGVYYGVNENNELIFYDLTGRQLTFDMDTGTATASNGESPVPGTIVRQNGIYYAPAYAICRYFGLSYSFYTTDYGPLLRIKDGNAVLSDQLFLSSAASLMQSRLNAATRGQTGGSGGSGGTTVTPAPTDPDEPTFSLYLGLRTSADEDLSRTLDALAAVNASAVIFFPADDVRACADQIRQAAGRGHRIGLIPDGDTSEARLVSVRAAGAVLTRVLRQESWFVLSSDRALAEEGYLCWTPGLTLAAGRSSAALYDSVKRYAADRTEPGRVLLDAKLPASLIGGLVDRLATAGDTFLRPRETRY